MPATSKMILCADDVDVRGGDSDGLHHVSAPFWARFGGLVPSRYTQFYGTRIRVSTGWGVLFLVSGALGCPEVGAVQAGAG